MNLPTSSFKMTPFCHLRALVNRNDRITSRMRLFSLILCAIWPITLALGASSKGGDKYPKFRAASRSTGAVTLDDASYHELTAAPRDYHTVVLLTALDSRFGCDVCKMFQPEWELLSRTWSKAKLGDSKLVFGTLDFLDGKGTFQQVIERQKKRHYWRYIAVLTAISSNFKLHRS